MHQLQLLAWWLKYSVSLSCTLSCILSVGPRDIKIYISKSKVKEVLPMVVQVFADVQAALQLHRPL